MFEFRYQKLRSRQTVSVGIDGGWRQSLLGKNKATLPRKTNQYLARKTTPMGQQASSAPRPQKKTLIIVGKLKPTEFEYAKADVQLIQGLEGKNSEVKVRVITDTTTKEEVRSWFTILKFDHVAAFDIYYTGHGQKDTGNWPVENSTVSYAELCEWIGLQSKPIWMQLDCCYSYLWKAPNDYDNIDVWTSTSPENPLSVWGQHGSDKLIQLTAITQRLREQGVIR